MTFLKNKSILITGGTGSFGKAFCSKILSKYKDIKKLVIFSRDEFKQFEMEKVFSTLKYKNIRYFLGDVRDRKRLSKAFEDIDIVIHAAALKQVPSCEFFPLEAVKTNILGTENVLTCAAQEGVKKAVILTMSSRNDKRKI